MLCLGSREGGWVHSINGWQFVTTYFKLYCTSNHYKPAYVTQNSEITSPSLVLVCTACGFVRPKRGCWFFSNAAFFVPPLSKLS